MPALTRSGYMRSVVRIIAFALVAVAVSVASASAKQPKLVVLHPRFHVVATGVAGVFTDGRDVLWVAGEGTAQTSTLLDERNGTRSTVSYPGCYVDALNTASPFGGPWLMFKCDLANQGQGGFELYNLTTREWKSVALAPEILSYRNGCGSGPYCGVSLAGFGADWLEWKETCRECDATYLFQNINTGQVRTLPGWQAGGTTIPDLDSPSLAGTLCPPLTVPAILHPGYALAPEPGVLSFYGPFAIAGNVLERCSSRLHRTIDRNYDPLGGDSHAIVWGASTERRRLDGVFLPSLRRFVITTLPGDPSGSFPHSPHTILLSSRALYVIENGGETLYATHIPKMPRRLTGRRRS